MIMIYYVIWPRVKDSASLEVSSGWICQSKSPTPGPVTDETTTGLTPEKCFPKRAQFFFVKKGSKYTDLSLLSNSYLRKRISKPSRLQLLPFTLAMEKRCLSLIENKKVGHVPSSQLNGKYIDNGSRANSA